jgi:hypothetical protein
VVNTIDPTKGMFGYAITLNEVERQVVQKGKPRQRRGQVPRAPAKWLPGRGSRPRKTSKAGARCALSRHSRRKNGRQGGSDLDSSGQSFE